MTENENVTRVEVKPRRCPTSSFYPAESWLVVRQAAELEVRLSLPQAKFSRILGRSNCKYIVHSLFTLIIRKMRPDRQLINIRQQAEVQLRIYVAKYAVYGYYRQALV